MPGVPMQTERRAPVPLQLAPHASAFAGEVANGHAQFGAVGLAVPSNRGRAHARQRACFLYRVILGKETSSRKDTLLNQRGRVHTRRARTFSLSPRQPPSAWSPKISHWWCSRASTWSPTTTHLRCATCRHPPPPAAVADRPALRGTAASPSPWPAHRGDEGGGPKPRVPTHTYALAALKATLPPGMWWRAMVP